MKTKIEDLNIDPKIQLSQRGLDDEIVRNYAEAVTNESHFPPIVVFNDGVKLWLADGFHRVSAYRQCGFTEIEANFKDGTYEDALIYAATANVVNGKPMSRTEKKEAGERLLRLTDWSQERIAKELAISRGTISDWKSSLRIRRDTVETTRNGVTYQMDTSKIGQAQESEEVGETFQDDLIDENEYTSNPIDNTEQDQPAWLTPLSDEPVNNEPATYQVEMDLTSQPVNEVVNLPFKSSIDNFYTVEQWEELEDNKRQSLLETTGDKKFNPTNDNVEWAMFTWNPVTGCLHNCPYCYARDIAKRHYNHIENIEDRFTPIFYPDRLTAPQNTKIPDLSRFDKDADKVGHKSVFVCSMADLWGKWVPREWIEAVLEQVRNNPQWNFIFLTKFPIRMSEFEFPKNTMVGTTVDSQFAVERAEKAFRKITAGIKWLSCEPMMERLTFGSLDMFDWVVCGGASKSSQTPEFRPPREWIEHLRMQAKSAGCAFYEKTNLGAIPYYKNDGRTISKDENGRSIENNDYIVFERERGYPNWDDLL